MSFTLSGGEPTVEVSASASVDNNYSSTQAKVVIQTQAWFVYEGSWVQSKGVVVKVTCDDQTTTITLFGNGNSWSYADGTAIKNIPFIVDKGAAKSISWSVDFHSYIDRTDLGSKAIKSGSVNIGAKTYTISFDANGGSGAPASQTKTHGQTLTLSSTKPTRKGYTFMGWGIYDAGASFNIDSNYTLYAVWEENALTINYYSNYATSAFEGAENTVGADKNVRVKTHVLYYNNDYPNGLENYSGETSGAYMTRTGYTATGYWNTEPDGSGTSKHESDYIGDGEAYANVFGLTLEEKSQFINVYAQWRENKLTVKYHSNFATTAFEGCTANVGANEDVVVLTYDFGYKTKYEYGLHDYSNEIDATYLARERYNAVGYWGTSKEVYTRNDRNDADGVISNNNEIAIHEKNFFESGQSLAEAFGLTLEDGDKEIDLYAQWELAASNVTVYDAEGKPHKGVCCMYIPNMQLVTRDGETFKDSTNDYFITNNGGVRYGIITIYDGDGNPRVVV